MSRRDRLVRLLWVLMIGFCAGALIDWWARDLAEERVERPPKGGRYEEKIAPTPSSSVAPPSSAAPQASVATRSPSSVASAFRRTEQTTPTTGVAPSPGLRVPIDGADVESFKGQFAERRGDRPHEAVDILAPQNTPVHAVEDGTIAKLFVSNAGGNTIYQFNPTGEICFYYAHLERYAEGLHEGQRVSKGDVIGYVGTSGNAPAGTPHLHFAVFKLGPERRWWRGEALDPYEVFRETP